MNRIILNAIALMISYFIYCKNRGVLFGQIKPTITDSIVYIFIPFFIANVVWELLKEPKEPFFLERQGLPSEEITIDNRVYMCKDKADTPASCNTYGIGDPILNKYIDISAPCPKNWLEPGNSIYN